jgi:hypothetical protein
VAAMVEPLNKAHFLPFIAKQERSWDNPPQE